VSRHGRDVESATGLDKGLRAVVLVAGLAVTARWEHQYGAKIHLGWFAWAIPVLTAGYLTLSIRRDRDVLPAMGAALASTLVGALSSTLSVPAPALAAGTATLVAGVAYRAHVILYPDDAGHKPPLPPDAAPTPSPPPAPTAHVVPVGVTVTPPPAARAPEPLPQASIGPARRSKTPAQCWDEIQQQIASGGLPTSPTGDGIRDALAIAPARARWLRDRIRSGQGRPADGEGWAR
jgi:hypothetical protein